ncbi:MAG TPA: shikimate dehydrogenase [Candidatus Udaeobacter sp.]|nr:shikimate dehydrogenase [Candidatus Udaeobacter sp.]
MNEQKQTTERYTVGDLERWNEIARGVDPPIRLGVLGDPVAHSLSPQMQNAALQSCEIGMQYGRFHIRANELRSALSFLRKLDFIGINVTVPHKIAAAGQVDELDESARRCGAVNTIKIDATHSAVATEENQKLIGFNTDGEGFVRAIRAEFSVDVRDLRVMILGAGGGTGRAMAWQCALENCERLLLVNRTLEKAHTIAEQLRPFFSGPRVLGPAARLEALTFDETAMRLQLSDIDLIVNATPLGMNRSDPAPVPGRLLAPHHMVFDCVYGTSKSALLQAAEQAGARGANGLSMLLYQGALSFSIWFDREAPMEAMRKAL